jgi:hypothetical protein
LTRYSTTPSEKTKGFLQETFQSVALQPWQNQTREYISRAWRYRQRFGLGKIKLASIFPERGTAGCASVSARAKAHLQVRFQSVALRAALPPWQEVKCI